MVDVELELVPPAFVPVADPLVDVVPAAKQTGASVATAITVAKMVFIEVIMYSPPLRSRCVHERSRFGFGSQISVELYDKIRILKRTLAVV
jgi:hypothetical protein